MAGRGGARRGAGRKPKLVTAIREKAIEDANDDAKYALGLIIGYMRDDCMLPNFRKGCAEIVMDRVWGKPTQRNEHTGKSGDPIEANVHINLSELTNSELDALAGIAERFTRNQGGKDAARG